jgi:MFS family permease
VGSFILVSGRLGDVFGHKRLLILGYLWYGVWSMVVGLSIYSGTVLFDVARKCSRFVELLPFSL